MARTTARVDAPSGSSRNSSPSRVGWVTVSRTSESEPKTAVAVETEKGNEADNDGLGDAVPPPFATAVAGGTQIPALHGAAKIFDAWISAPRRDVFLDDDSDVGTPRDRCCDCCRHWARGIFSSNSKAGSRRRRRRQECDRVECRMEDGTETVDRRHCNVRHDL